jgi:hypothetical protein
MAIHVMTGKLGGGKTLCSVGRIRDRLRSGCPVATNLDLDLVAMFGHSTRDLNVIRIPDKPLIDDMHGIGIGNTSYDENLNGLLVLDECGTWFNSRNWSDKARKPVNDWFLHARKLGWDVILIIQDIKLLDSQARDALAEHTVFCKRMDRIQIPFIGSIYKAITGYRLSGPRVHVAKSVYGISPTDPVSDRWVYRGLDLFSCYDTKQLFMDEYPHQVHSLLTPWHLRGRFSVTKDKDFYMRITKIYWKRFHGPAALFAGSVLGMVLGLTMIPIVQAMGFIDEQKIPESETLAISESPVIEGNTFDQGGLISETTSGLSESDPVQQPVGELFGSWGISGYMQSRKNVVYTFTDGAGNHYKTAEVEDLGYRLRPVSNCSVEFLPIDDAETVAATIFAENCTVRDFTKKALDLSTIPLIAEFAVNSDNLPSYY